MRLWREHLGELGGEVDAQIEDPCSPEAWELLRQRAEANTEIYERIWPFCPSDQIGTADDAKERLKRGVQDSLEIRNDVLKGMRGHVCTYPLRFLCNETRFEDMKTKAADKWSGGTMWY